MSATVASVAILSVALLAGFVWWERTQPPSRLLALVATLAALAAIGRIAFAPIPNVKPTTDIVLFAGFALGAAPGFVVGAVAALSSNFFFGQGPWTPWQMAAWGLVGLLGAGLARLAPESGRWRLALACGFAGLLYGELLNASLWVNYSDHSLSGLLAYMGRGVPFDAAHVIGNVIFCLAFGPAFVAALTRFKTRMSIRWVPVAATWMLALAFAPLAIAATPSQYLEGAQNADGGFGAEPGEPSSELYTGWTALGLEAAGRNPAEVRRPGGTSLLAYLKAHIDDAGDTGARSRTLLALEAAGSSSPQLVAAILRERAGTGAFEDRVNTTAFALMALKAAGTGGMGESVRWLKSQQNPDGGWNFAGKGGQSGIDDTGAPLQALVAWGQRRSKAVRRAASFLARQQNPDGGFPLSPGGASNAQSTAWAVQGLIAAGRNPTKVRRHGSRNPIAYLRSLTGPDGAVRYDRTSSQTPVWVTAQALAALARKPFPLRPLAPLAVRSVATPAPTAAATPEPKREPRPEADARVVAEPEIDVAPLARAAGMWTAVFI